MECEFTKEPNQQDINFLTDKINQETSANGSSSPFAFFIRNNDQQIIAGANGIIIYGTIYTDQIWVDGFGRNSGCSLATIQTMSFQEAEFFYKKLGYVRDFRRRRYINDSQCIFMKKEL